MKIKKYTSILLIASSLVLLGAFQCFWLYKSYQEQRELLTKQTDNLFQTTLSAQEDNLLSQSLNSTMFFRNIKTKLATNKNPHKTTPKPQIEHAMVQLAKQAAPKVKPVIPTKNTIQIKSSLSLTNKKDTMLNIDNGLFNITNLNIVSDDPNEVKNYSKLIRSLVKQVIVTGQLDTLRQKKRPRFIFLQSQGDTTSVPVLTKDSIAKIIDRRKTMALSIDSTIALNGFKSFVLQTKKHKPTTSQPKENGSAVTISVHNNKDQTQSKSISIVNTKSNEKIEILIDIKPDSIQKAYQKSLDKVQIPLKFAIKINPTKDTTSIDSLKTSIYKGNLSSKSYQAVFDNVRPYLFKKILPQSLFSLFLLSLVGLSFGLIYRSLQQQRRLTELKNDFISNITHELKTPITTVGVAIEALSSFNVLANPVQTQEYLDISKSELNRLSLLVDRVLKMAVFEQSDPELHLENINLEEQVNTVMKSMKLQFEKYKAEVVFDTEGQNFDLQGDRIHIANVLYNLLDNALKYANGQPKIHLKLIDKASSVVLIVQDQGLGIEPAYQQKIFDKFFRVPTGNTHNVKGHGLGLSYVASVVNIHQGQISVESQEGHGTNFELILPKKMVL